MSIDKGDQHKETLEPQNLVTYLVPEQKVEDQQHHQKDKEQAKEAFNDKGSMRFLAGQEGATVNKENSFQLVDSSKPAVEAAVRLRSKVGSEAKESEAKGTESKSAESKDGKLESAKGLDDDEAHITKVTYPDGPKGDTQGGTERTFHYGNDGKVDGFKDRDGSTWSKAADGSWNHKNKDGTPLPNERNSSFDVDPKTGVVSEIVPPPNGYVSIERPDGHKTTVSTDGKTIVQEDASGRKDTWSQNKDGTWTERDKSNKVIGEAKLVGVDPANGDVFLDGNPEKIERRKETSAEGKTHEVKSGDNLWKIARKELEEQLGHKPTPKEIAGYVKKIYEANKDVIGDDANKIYPDQKLKLPDSKAPEQTEAKQQPSKIESQEKKDADRSKPTPDAGEIKEKSKPQDGVKEDADHPKSIKYPDGKTRDFDYDKSGKLNAFKDTDGTYWSKEDDGKWHHYDRKEEPQKVLESKDQSFEMGKDGSLICTKEGANGYKGVERKDGYKLYQHNDGKIIEATPDNVKTVWEKNQETLNWDKTVFDLKNKDRHVTETKDAAKNVTITDLDKGKLKVDSLTPENAKV